MSIGIDIGNIGELGLAVASATAMATEWLNQAFDSLLAHATNPNKRLFWGYSLATVVLVGLVYFFEYKRTGQFNWRRAFGKDVLLSTSSKLDVKIWLVNIGIKLWLIAPVLISVAPIAIWLNNTLNSLFGESVFKDVSDTTVMVTFTLVLFLLDDFSRFLLHWLMHKIPALWSIHKLHHSAEVLTPITVYRTHPIESWLYATRLMLVNAVTIGVGVYLFSAQLNFYNIAGANIGVFLFNLFGANLRHSQVWLSWGSTLEKWFISPAQHQIHHSQAIEHHDKNFGSALAIWDRLFGTLVSAKSVSKSQSQSDPLLLFGVEDFEPKSLWQAYAHPIKDMLPRRQSRSSQLSPSQMPPSQVPSRQPASAE